jgi:hypothetical protein
LARNDIYTGTFTGVATGSAFDAQSLVGAYVLFYGTYAGANVSFEGSADGGTTWIPLGAYRLDSAGTSGLSNSTGVLTTNSTSHWFVIIGAAQQVRLKTTAFTSGTLSWSVMTSEEDGPVNTLMSNFSSPAALADSFVNPTTSHLGSEMFLYNGTAWDRQRANYTLAFETSSAKTSSSTSANVTNHNGRGGYIQINVTAVSGSSPTLTCRVQYSVDSGTNFVDLDTTNAQTASITTTGLYQLRVYPGIAAVANSACNAALPRTWRLAWTIGGSSPSFTFSANVAHVL